MVITTRLHTTLLLLIPVAPPPPSLHTLPSPIPEPRIITSPPLPQSPTSTPTANASPSAPPRVHPTRPPQPPNLPCTPCLPHTHAAATLCLASLIASSASASCVTPTARPPSPKRASPSRTTMAHPFSVANAPPPARACGPLTSHPSPHRTFASPILHYQLSPTPTAAERYRMCTRTTSRTLQLSWLTFMRLRGTPSNLHGSPPSNEATTDLGPASHTN